MAEVAGMQIFESPEVAEDAAPPKREKERPGDSDLVETAVSPSDAFAMFAGSSFSTSSTDFTDKTDKEQLKRKNFLAQRGDETSFRGKEVFEPPAQRRLVLQQQLAEFSKDLSDLSEKGDKVSTMLAGEMKKLEASLNATCNNASYKHLLEANYPLTEAHLAQKNAVASLTKSLQALSTTPAPINADTANNDSTFELYGSTGTSKDTVSTLSNRLDIVEKRLGVNSAENLAFPDMLVGLTHLERKLADLSLDKQHDAMRRINGLRIELENIEKQKQTVEGAKPAEEEAKILRLYSMMDRWGKASEILPVIVARMQSLKDLEQEGSGAVARAQGAKKSVENITKLLAEDKQLLQSMTKTVHESVKSIQDTTTQIQAKFDALAGKF